MKQQNSYGESVVLKLNLKEFLTEFFMDRTGKKEEFSYGLFWDAVKDTDCHESIRLMTDYEPKEDGSFYYEYGLLKAEEEMEADCEVIELNLDGIYSYNIRYENPDEKPVSFYFYTKTRIMAFIQHENEVLEVAWEMQEIVQQKPILCLESHKSLFCRALDAILEAYSKDEYSEEDLQREYCPDNSEVAIDWMQYKFGCSDKYEADYCCGYSALETNVGYAIDAAWTWFHTGYVNNFISLNPATHRIHLSW